MDLNVLFASQIERLEQCYLELGHAPERLQLALQTAIDNEVNRSIKEINDADVQIHNLLKKCQSYCTVLDESKNSSMESISSDTSMNLFAKIKNLQHELDRLQTIYNSRKIQAEKIVVRIEEYRPILGDQVPQINLDLPDADDSTEVLLLPRPSELHAILSSCAEEVRRRNTEMEESLSAIVQLWSDLWHAPNSNDEFDCMIMHHLNIRPSLADVGEEKAEFAGVFEHVEGATAMEATPSRKSGSNRELGTQVGRIQHHKAMAPTLDNLSRASGKVKELELEKTRRFELIQELFKELSLLWKRFDVGDDAVDDFVQENTGCTLAAILAYERELKQMKELKAEHMSLFISKVREDIASLWDQLLMTDDERRDSLPEFFQDLIDGEDSGVEPSDELLALHEEKVKELNEELAIKARPLELVRQYKKLLEEAQELEASAKDISRLTGRGATGQRRDPGRLLREEKMRKRIKVMKPKIEEELMRFIPAWEEESGRAFCINGERFLDTVEIQCTSPKKRMRTASSTIAATPQTQIKRSRIESSQSVPASVQKVMATPHSFSTPAHPLPRSGLPKPTGIRAPASCLRIGVRNALQNHDTNRMASHSSDGSAASNATTIIHKAASSSSSTTTTTTTKVKRRGPSLLVEESIRNSGFSKSDFAKPCSTGVGASLRPLATYSTSRLPLANESIGGPNWAVLDEEEESHLLA